MVQPKSQVGSKKLAIIPGKYGKCRKFSDDADFVIINPGNVKGCQEGHYARARTRHLNLDFMNQPCTARMNEFNLIEADFNSAKDFHYFRCIRCSMFLRINR